MIFYFVNDREDILFSVDTSTGAIKAVTNDPTSGGAAAFSVLGGLTYVDSPTTGAQLWCRAARSTTDLTSVGFRIAADTLASASLSEVKDSFVHTAGGTYPYWGPRYNSGWHDVAGDVVWLPWQHNITDNSETYLWTCFDPAGDVVDYKGNAWFEPDGSAMNNAYAFIDYHIGSNTCWVKDGWAYNGFDVNEGKCRVNLTTGEVQGVETFDHDPTTNVTKIWNMLGYCSDGPAVTYVDGSSEYVDVFADSQFAFLPMSSALPRNPTMANGDAPLHHWPLFGDGVSAPAVGTTSISYSSYADAFRLVGDDLYYTSAGDDSTIAFTIWQINLLSGAISRVYDVPFTVINADGTIGSPTGSYYDDINRIPHSMVVVTTTPSTGRPQPYRAPLRLYPRSDARRWPRPGSVQASPRRVGGYR